MLSNFCKDAAIFKTYNVSIATITLLVISVLFLVVYVLTFLKISKSKAQKKSGGNIDRNLLV